MKKNENQVENILRNYTAMKRELQVLELELKCMTTNLHPETIMNKVFTRSGHEPVSTSAVSDKTADIVIDHVDSQRNSVYHALNTLISNLRLEIRRLEHYISLLPENEKTVLCRYYFEGLSRPQISKDISCSVSTVKRLKNKALDKIVHCLRF